jgi:tetratricopeptide (TPR) repeat protein
MDLLTLDPIDENAGMADGLRHAARGDWHAAASAFDAALAAIDVPGASGRERDARLAAAVTNLGHARAYLGALDEAATLLARSVAIRERLVADGAAGPLVAARGLTDLAAVRAAAGDADGAREALTRATPLTDGDEAITRVVAEGLALLGGEPAPSAPSATQEAGLAFLDLGGDLLLEP